MSFDYNDEDMVKAAKQDLIEAGFNANVATALAENGLEVSDTVLMTADELFEKFLEWEGIQGYTRTIIDALDNCRDMDIS